MTTRIIIAAGLAAVALTASAADARPRGSQDSRERMTTRQLNQQQLASSTATASPMQANQPVGPAEPAGSSAAAPEAATTPVTPTTETTPPTDSTVPTDAAPMAAPPR